MQGILSELLHTVYQFFEQSVCCVKHLQVWVQSSDVTLEEVVRPEQHVVVFFASPQRSHQSADESNFVVSQTFEIVSVLR